MSATTNGHDGSTAVVGGKMAKPLDPDLNPWDQQPTEATEQYRAFVEFRDSNDRKVRLSNVEGMNEQQVAALNSRRQRWSATWSWGYRARAWDRWMSQQDLDMLVRYRREMNTRHRAVARQALNKAVVWLQALEPERLKPMEAARLIEVATRIEREAAGVHLAAEGDLPEDGQAPVRQRTLAEILSTDENTESALAQMIHEAIGSTYMPPSMAPTEE
jgi:hypothetical protein